MIKCIMLFYFVLITNWTVCVDIDIKINYKFWHVLCYSYIKFRMIEWQYFTIEILKLIKISHYFTYLPIKWVNIISIHVDCMVAYKMNKNVK